MLTYSDFEKADDRARFVLSAISTYRNSNEYRMAELADEYDAQRNVTIQQTVRKLYTASGAVTEDPTVANNRIACNLFNRLNTQRCMYSLGNGVTFIDPYEAAKGAVDETKELLGRHFDHVLREAGYHALIHGWSYLFWDLDRVHVFTMREFVPLVDEYDGSLRAGIRFWQLDSNRPMNAVLYEQDGYTTYQTGTNGGLVETKPKTSYKVTYVYTEADDDALDVIEENYSSLPIVRMYGSRLKQSTLVGMREAIDSYDLIQSGFANDLSDCAQIFWLVENYGGMDDEDLAEFLEKLKLNHVANVDTASGGHVTPYTQEIPHEARKAYLDDIRARIYEDFGGLDVHTVAAGATNDHIDAAYQPLDENAADFEHWVSDAIVQLLALQGIEDTPVFKRQRISNQKEQVEMLVQEAAWLDEATILRKLPNLTPDEVVAVMLANEDADMERFGVGGEGENEGE